MTCKHYNPRKVECAKGDACDCARECADENIVDFIPVTTCDDDLLVIPFGLPLRMDDTWIRHEAKREHAERLTPAKCFYNAARIGCVVWALVMIVWALL